MTEATNTQSASTYNCKHTTKSGQDCKAATRSGSSYCFFHDPAVRTERTEARRAGGTERSRKVVLPPDGPDKPLRAICDVVELVSDTVNQVRRGEIDIRVSNAVGYLSGILISALEKGQMEERIAALEVAVKAQQPKEPAEAENESFVFDETVRSHEANDNYQAAGEN